MLSNSRGPESIRELAQSIGCNAGTAPEAAEFGDMIFVAIFLQDYQAVPRTPLAGKIVLNLQNYFPHLGQIEELDREIVTTAELLARHLPESRTVKVLNSMLVQDSRPAGSVGRRTIPIAGDDVKAKEVVSGPDWLRLCRCRTSFRGVAL